MITIESSSLLGFNIIDFYQFSLCSAIIIMVFHLISPYVETEKAKAWIITTLSSFILSLFGIHAVYRAEMYDLWTFDNVYGGEDSISRLVLIFFGATNIIDLIIGSYYYPKYLDPFSTIAHHIFYISFITVLIGHHYSRGFILCFLMEIPTFVLGIGRIWKERRSDILFGLTFFITRLIYNIYLVNKLKNIASEGIIWKICLCVFLLHMYWFSKWYGNTGTQLQKRYSFTKLIGLKIKSPNTCEK